MSIGSRTKRLSRVESRAITRSRLLEAAKEVFVERGFAGASVEEISERAGYTRGAFYSNFDDKDDIFVAVFEIYLNERIAEVTDIVRAASSLEEAFAVIRRGNVHRDSKTWSMLQAEYWLYAMRNPKARPKLAQIYRTERRAYERAIRAQFDAAGLDVPIRLRDAALVAQLLDENAPRLRFIDPKEIDEDFFFRAILQLLEAGLALARERSK